MKPNFTLSLSFEGIRLLHRAAGGWRVVGEVALTATDMPGELAVLRRTATALEPGGLRTKLLLPNAQIKYLTIDTPGLSQAERREAARKALDGATPYAVDDLAFDLSADGDDSHIAAVAKETLAEAESFAVEHRFHPVCFAAVPEENPYLGEPFFGPTETAATLLAPGEEVEPDGIAVVVIGDVELDQSPATDDAVTEEDAETHAEDDTSEADAPAAESETRDEPKENAEAERLAEDAGDEPDELAADGATETAVAKDDTSDTPVVAEDTAADIAPEGNTGTPEETAPIPVMPRLGPASRAAPTSKTIPPAPPPDVPASGFASRRAAPASPPARQEPVVTASVTLDEPERPASLPTMAKGSVTEPALAVPVAPDSSSLRAAPVAPEPVADAAPKGGFLSRRRAKGASGGRRLTLKPLVAGTAPAVAKPRNEAERMTVFGARKSAEIGGKPRFLGLMLTTALLVFLAGVAAWASVFMDDGLNLSRFFGDRTPQTVAAAPAAPVTQPTVPSTQPEAPETVVTASLEPTLTEEDSAVLDALRDPVPPQVRELTPEERDAKYAATGIWPVAPVVPPEPAGLVTIDDLYLTSIDPISTANDAVALPSATSFATDVAFGKVASPAAAGTAFALDENGLVIPTAQGALSPDGIIVYLGRPPAVLPETPTRFLAEPVDTRLRDALAAFRPKPRPADLTENTERAQLGGVTRGELAEFRPRLRPRSVQEQAQAQAEAEAAEQARAAASAAASVVNPEDTDAAVQAAVQAAAFQNPTRFATTSSARPDVRPRNFARIVRRAQRAKPESQETGTRVAAAAQVAPRTVTPKIPSRTSVTKQATVRNAINLRKINLIGVYGKPSNRRALVRLGNGRYRKVVVGDRIDGGRVRAIGDSELRYTKGGRNVVLKMPN